MYLAIYLHCSYCNICLQNVFSLQLPEGSNQLRQMQLRELAMLNGTLREDGIVSTFIHFVQKYLHAIFLRDA